MKKGLAVAMAALLGVATMGTTAMAAASGDITICSREDGSGTRGAFIELFGIEEKDADGNKVDNTTEAAKITNSTSVMLSTVAQDVNAIGYVSLGSLDDSVTALKIDGAEATAENIESGDYKVVRPFNIATKDDVSEAAQDFITYIMSADGCLFVIAMAVDAAPEGNLTVTVKALSGTEGTTHSERVRAAESAIRFGGRA